jgi:hypothetical protein
MGTCLVVFVVGLLTLLVLDGAAFVEAAAGACSHLGLLKLGRIAQIALESLGPIDITARLALPVLGTEQATALLGRLFAYHDLLSGFSSQKLLMHKFF